MPSLSLDEVRNAIGPVEGRCDRLPERVDVLVVGAGPIGLTAANLLGQFGIRTALVEKNAATADLPRALAVDDEYMRLLHRIGMGPALLPHQSAPFGIYFYSRKGKPLVRVPAFQTPNGFANRTGIMQPVLEKELLAATVRHPSLSVHYGCEATDIEQSADGVTLTVAGPGGAPHDIRARFLLACDGARSFVRNRLGIAFAGQRMDEPHLVIDLADFGDEAPYSRFHCRPERPFNSIPTPYGGRRVEFMLNDGDDREAIASPDSIRRLMDTTPHRGAPIHVIRSVVYGYSARMAEAMQKGNVFLLGDAAHVMPPFGAQAMNTGARDVNNLCWKIHAVIGGIAGPGLLAGYEPERRPQIERIVRYSVRVGRLTNIRSRPLAALRDGIIGLLNLVPPVRRYLSSMRYMPRPELPADRVFGEDGEKAFLGRPFPHVTLRDGAGTESGFDALFPGFVLVAVNVGDAEMRKLAAHPMLARLGAATLRIGGNGGFSPAQAHDKTLLAGFEGRFTLVRPDRQVVAVMDAADHADMLGRVEAQLALA